MIKKSLLLSFLTLLVILLFTCSTETKTECNCYETTYTYGAYNTRTASDPVKVACPGDFEKGETRYYYDGFGRIRSTITMECKENTKGIFN